MSDDDWTYPEEFLVTLATLGLAPTSATPATLVRDALNDLYRYELRRLRDGLRAGRVEKADYLDHVIALRKKYWPLSLTPPAWEQICRSYRPS